MSEEEIPKPHHFKIIAGPSGHHTHVEMNGKRLRNARAIDVRTAVGEATAVVVEFIGVTAEFEGFAELVHAETTHMGSKNREYEPVR